MLRVTKSGPVDLGVRDRLVKDGLKHEDGWTEQDLNRRKDWVGVRVGQPHHDCLGNGVISKSRVDLRT